MDSDDGGGARGGGGGGSASGQESPAPTNSASANCAPANPAGFDVDHGGQAHGAPPPQARDRDLGLQQGATAVLDENE
jgi:hypothetical protein